MLENNLFHFDYVKRHVTCVPIKKNNTRAKDKLLKIFATNNSTVVTFNQRNYIYVGVFIQSYRSR